MGKGTNFSGQPVLSQLIKLMDRSKINTLASKSGANYYTKHLDGYSHLVVMLYAVLSNLRSLRETCLGFAANATRMNHLGIDHMICRSTLSDANKRRKSSFFGSIYRSLYNRYASFLSDSLTKREVSTKLHVMDSTTISLFSLRYLGESDAIRIMGRKKAESKFIPLLRRASTFLFSSTIQKA